MGLSAERINADEAEDVKGPNISNLKLDARGVPLVPHAAQGSRRGSVGRYLTYTR
jgi:hypothetical protein